MGKPGAVIFDLDGVLVDSYRAHLESWQRLAAESGVTLTEAQYAAVNGRGGPAVIRAVFKPESLTPERIARLHQRKNAIYHRVLAAGFAPIEGAIDLVRALHEAGYRIAVASSALRENIDDALERLGLGPLVSASVGLEDVERSKPDPEVFRLAAQRLDVEPPWCVVIEDSPAGVAAANAAGMASIGLAGRHDAEELAGAVLVVRSLREVSPEVVGGLVEN